MNNDLISREALRKAFEDCAGECACCIHNTNDFEYCGLIDNAPTVDTTCPHCDSGYAQGLSDGYLKGKEERPHGKWKLYNAYFKTCSLCNKTVGFDYIEQNGEKFNYCPNCGAKMDGGEE